MKNIFELVQILQNLNRIKRTGGHLAIGLPQDWNISIAEHSYTVTYLAMILADKLNDKEINVEKLLRYCLLHDWTDSVIGDWPSGSPSYASFWEIDIRKEVARAEEKAKKQMLEMIKNETDISKFETELNEKEKKILAAADMAAMLFEMLEWKYLGYRHDGWEMIWFNSVDRLGKIDLPFIKELVNEFNDAYKRETKRPHRFLAQAKMQVNPEHKI